MARRSGRAAKVTVGTYKVAGLGTWTMDGASRGTIDNTEFGDDALDFEFGMLDPGTLTFSGGWDPDDATGQAILDSACINASKLGHNDIRLYVDNTSYWTVNTSGFMLVTKCRAISMEKTGLGQISFTVQVAKQPMVLV